MSPSQTELLRQLIAADRAYRTELARTGSADPCDRGIEVISINGVSKRTALSLVEAGLAEMVATSRNANPWLFLGKCEPLDE